MQKAFGALDGFDETQPWLKRIAINRQISSGADRPSIASTRANRLALMPWITIVAFVPLGYVLRRRNL